MFQGTRISLQVWFQAICWVVSQKNGANALGIQRVLGLGSYRTAWTWLHKIRRAMVRPGRARLTGQVEVDETLIGGVEHGGGGRNKGKKALVIIASEVRDRAIGGIRIGTVEDATATNLIAFVQELADIKIGDLKADKTPQVKLRGKGGKERIIPLWNETSEMLQRWLNAREILKITNDNLFVNAQRRKISRFGIAHILSKHTAIAAEECSSLQNKKVTPHTIRHTTALYLIQSNVDIETIKDWLGHTDIRTTSLYIDINIEMKRKALEQCPPLGVKKDEPMLWHQQKTMVLLQSIGCGSYVE